MKALSSFYLICATIYRNGLRRDVCWEQKKQTKWFLILRKAKRKRKIRNVNDNNNGNDIG